MSEPDQECCAWCDQRMNPDDAGDYITCPNGKDICIDCCPCCG